MKERRLMHMIKTMIMKHCLFISMMAVCCGSIALVEAEAGAQAQLPGFERPTAAAVFKGDGAALEILSKSWDPTAHGDGAMDASGAEGADATFEMMFKAESVSRNTIQRRRRRRMKCRAQYVCS